VAPATTTTAVAVAWAGDGVQEGKDELGKFP
jgi:hypothetical protein